MAEVFTVVKDEQGKIVEMLKTPIDVALTRTGKLSVHIKGVIERAILRGSSVSIKIQ